MKRTSPFPVHSYPWYVQDWRESRSRMTMDLETRAFYRELLDYCVTTGSFPADPKILAQIAMCTEAEAARLWPKVEHKFSKKGTECTNKKAAEVRDLIQDRKGKISTARRLRGLSEKSPSDLGDVSNKKRRRLRESEGEGEGDGEGEGEVVVPEAQKKKLEVPLPRGYAMDEQYEDFRNACKSWGMNVVDPEDFIAAWPEWRVLDGFQRAAAVAGIYDLRNAGADPAFAKSPRNYLRSREWKRPIKSAKSSGLSAEEIAAL